VLTASPATRQQAKAAANALLEFLGILDGFTRASCGRSDDLPERTIGSGERNETSIFAPVTLKSRKRRAARSRQQTHPGS
jgi:hypothetical protein